MLLSDRFPITHPIMSALALYSNDGNALPVMVSINDEVAAHCPSIAMGPIKAKRLTLEPLSCALLCMQMTHNLQGRTGGFKLLLPPSSPELVARKQGPRGSAGIG